MTSPSRKSLLRLTWPLFVFSFVTMGVTFADSLLVNAYSPALAATVSMANLILDIPYEISGALAVGTLILVAQSLGRGDEELARSAATIALAASAILGLATGITVFFSSDFLARLVNTPADILNDTILYTKISALTLVFNGFLTAATAILRGNSRTVAILVFGLAANAGYLFLEYALIFGRFGFPELGVIGAALSTVWIRALGVLLLGWYVWRILGGFCAISSLHSALQTLFACLSKLSFPTLAESIVFKLHQTVLVALLAVLGTSALLARSYALSLTAFLSLIPYVVSQGNDVLIGYDKGARDHNAAKKRAVHTTVWTALFTTAFASLIYVFREPLLHLFTRDPTVLAEAGTVLLITIAIQPFQSANTLFFGSLRTVGDVYTPVIYKIAVTWAIALPAGWFFITQLHWGVAGLWAAFLVEEFVKSTLMAARWLRMRWTTIDVLAPSAPATSIT